MGNPFDTMASLVHDTTAVLMGYDAEWTPKAGGETQTARVNFRNPSEDGEIAGKKFTTEDGIMEYKQGEFSGLRESLAKNEKETIYVTLPAGSTAFTAFKARSVYDGKTFRVWMQKKTS